MDCDCEQDADNRGDNQELDECKTLFALLLSKYIFKHNIYLLQKILSL
jgi:hypothetical protein